MLRLGVAEAAAIAGEPEELVAPLLAPRDAPGLAAQLRRLHEAGARVVALGESEYPALLACIADPPPLLFLRGVLPQAPSVAVVGARRASRSGLEAARAIAGGLARAGVAVVSGFARGIDAAAHGAALAAEGPTVAVLGCGVDVCYPPEQRRLFSELSEKGALVSELQMGTEPQAFFFPMRNRIIAGLSRITVVVEAAKKSGSLITARCAADSGRDVAAVPGTIAGPHAEGSNALLKDGAILVRDAADLLAELPDEDRARLGAAAAARVPERDLGEDAARVLAVLSVGEPQDADVLSAATGLSASRLAAALVELELEGLAEALPGASFARRS